MPNVVVDEEADAAASAPASAPASPSAAAHDLQPAKKLTPEQRRAGIALFLSKHVTKNGRLEHGACPRAAEEHGVSIGCVRDIWMKHRNAIMHPDKYPLDVSRKKGSGCKAKYTAAQVRAAVRAVPCRYRHSLRTLSAKVGIPRSTLHEYLKQDGILLSKSVATEGREGKDGRSSQGEDDDEITARQQQQRADAQKELERNSIRRIETQKIREEMKDYYEKRQARAIERAKKEAQEEHDRHVEELRAELRHEFDSEKDRVLYQLRMEMHRHQLELTRLRGELETIGGAKRKETGAD